MDEVAEIVGAVFFLIVGIVAIVPLVLFSISYNRVRSRNLLLTTIGFGLFVVKGLLLGARMFVPENIQDGVWYMNDDTWLVVAAVIDLVIIGLITASLLLLNKTRDDGKKSSSGKKKKDSSDE